MFFLHVSTKHIIFGWLKKKNLFYLNPKIEEKTIYVALRERENIYDFWNLFFLGSIENKVNNDSVGEWRGLTVSVEDCYSKGRGFESACRLFFDRLWCTNHKSLRARVSWSMWRTIHRRNAGARVSNQSSPRLQSGTDIERTYSEE